MDNPIGEALVEHGYSFARLQSFGGSAPVSLSVWYLLGGTAFAIPSFQGISPLCIHDAIGLCSCLDTGQFVTCKRLQ